MYEDDAKKYRDEDTWAMVRRAWEQGETAQSCARRFDVGLDNLWRRRAKGNWRRDRSGGGPPEPMEGWDRFAARALDAFELRRDEVRMLAEVLAAAMAGGPIGIVPIWHVGHVLRWRAERLGPETAAADRDWALGKADWVAEFWDGEGRLKALHALDGVTLRANRRNGGRMRGCRRGRRRTGRRGAAFSLPFMGRDVGAKRRQGGVRMSAFRPFRTPPGSLRDRPSP